MHEESLNGTIHAVAPKLRIVTKPHEPLGDDPSIQDLARALGSLEACAHHNFRAVVQEIDDLRATVHAVNRNAADGLAAGQRVEGILTEIVQAIRTIADRIGSIEARVDRQEAPTLPILQKDPT